MTGYFADLERELVSAAGRQNPAAEPQHTEPASPRRRTRSRRVVLVTAGLLAVVGVPAAAVSGVFRAHREADGLVRLSKQRVIVEGTTPDGAHWQLSLPKATKDSVSA